MEKLLSVTNVSAVYRVGKKEQEAIHNINLFVNRGEIVGVIGESGSGKTTLSDAILQLLPFKNGHVSHGLIEFRNNDVAKNKKTVIGNTITYIPQDPGSSLDPLMSIKDNFIEILKVHQKKITKKEMQQKIAMSLRAVHLSPESVNLNSYPHQLSGGMQQRILIALALLCGTELIIADEPTSNLDVTTERKIIELFKEVQIKQHIAFLFTTHNLRLAKYFCDRIYVFYMGTVVEAATSVELFNNPQHPYTQLLVASLPGIKEKQVMPARPMASGIPVDIQCGCLYKMQCNNKNNNCETVPEYMQITDTHHVRCWLAKKN